MEENTKYSLKVLQKAMKILNLYDAKGKALSLTEINDLLSFNKASTFRIIKNLEGAGYLVRDPGSMKFKLGPKLFQLGSLAEPGSDIARIARPFLQKLNERCGETVHLATLLNGEALYLDKIEGKKTIRVITRTGTRLHAHCSGVGKVLLSGLSNEDLTRLINEKGLIRFTDNTITDVNVLTKELANIRRNGYAVDNEEVEVGLKCVAAPIRDSEGKIVAALSISAPTERFHTFREAYISSVSETAKEVTAHMHKLNETHSG